MKRFIDFNKKDDDLQIVRETVDVPIEQPQIIEKIVEKKEIKEFVSVPGIPGTPGSIGPVGDRGAVGPAGPQGVQGEKGDVGEQGPQGEHGEDGEQGPVGPRGLQGDQGPAGLQGEIGPQGEQGIQGEKGDVGEQGPQGIAGEKGEQGEPGRDGRDGPKGIQGPRGERGPRGSKGQRGDLGSAGPAGERGEKGDRGDKGDPGDLSKITAQYPLIYDEKKGKLEFDTKQIEKAISKLNIGSVNPQDMAKYMVSGGGAVGIRKDKAMIIKSVSDINFKGDNIVVESRGKNINLSVKGLFSSGANPPSDANAGDRWYDTENDILFTRFDDNWVELGD